MHTEIQTIWKDPYQELTAFIHSKGFLCRKDLPDAIRNNGR